MYVKRMGFVWVFLCIWIGCLGIAAPCLGAEGPNSSEDLVSALRQVAVFQRLDEGQLRNVAKVAEVAEREEGDRIIEQGKRAGKMAIALDSEVRIRIDGEIIRVLPPNSLVGEIEFLENVPASADVVLVGKSRVILMEHRRFQQVMDADPSLGYRVMVEIARMEANRLRMNNQRRAR
ncbi:MAG: cyclic nucleotide-binding domain-containing protein [Candidatus Desulfacyla sp.]